jgi:hypothetical protein
MGPEFKLVVVDAHASHVIRRGRVSKKRSRGSDYAERKSSACVSLAYSG